MTWYERGYTDGQRAIYAQMLSEALRGLGLRSGIGDLLVEREKAIATLRRICETYGDNDWSPDLHLSDIIDRHIRWPDPPSAPPAADG